MDDGGEPTGRARSLLTGLLTVGLIGFGGGSALIPVIDKQLVQQRRLLDDPTYTRHTIVANITPGALPVKLAAAAGQTVSGPVLALVAALTVALPGVVGTLGLLAGSAALGPAAVRAITYASVGISAFIIVLLIGYIVKVHRQAGRQWPWFLAITVVSALATGAGTIVSLLAGLVGRTTTVTLPRLNAVQLILFALAVIVVGAIPAARRQRSTNRPDRSRPSLRPTWVATGWFLVATVVGIGVLVVTAGLSGLRLGALLALSAVASFGGGEAYIGVADGFFVNDGLVDREVFYTQLVPIANALPGPILVKVGAGIGYLSASHSGPVVALLVGCAAAVITIGSCCAVAMPVLGWYEELRDHPIVRSIGTYILPVICGLLVSVSATMLEVSARVAERAGASPTVTLWVCLAGVVAMTVLHLKSWVPDLVMLGVAGVASWVAFGLS